MGKNKPIIGFILGIIVAVVIFFANIPGLERTGQMCMAFSLMTVIFWAFGIAQSSFTFMVTAEWQSSIEDMEKLIPADFPLPARYAHPIVLDRMIRVLREGRAQSVKESLALVKEDLKKLDSSVQVEQEEYDEVVTVKPMFLCQDYK